MKRATIGNAKWRTPTIGRKLVVDAAPDWIRQLLLPFVDSFHCSNLCEEMAMRTISPVEVTGSIVCLYLYLQERAVGSPGSFRLLKAESKPLVKPRV
jgi:hypothetical protein